MATEFQTNLCSELRDNWVKCIFGRLISCVKPPCGIQDDQITSEDVIKAQLSKLTNFLPQEPLRDGQLIGKWIVLHGLGEGSFGK
jgi:hypothetical protein